VRRVSSVGVRRNNSGLPGLGWSGSARSRGSVQDRLWSIHQLPKALARWNSAHRRPARSACWACGLIQPEPLALYRHSRNEGPCGESSEDRSLRTQRVPRLGNCFPVNARPNRSRSVLQVLCTAVTISFTARLYTPLVKRGKAQIHKDTREYVNVESKIARNPDLCGCSRRPLEQPRHRP